MDNLIGLFCTLIHKIEGFLFDSISSNFVRGVDHSECSIAKSKTGLPLCQFLGLKQIKLVQFFQGQSMTLIFCLLSPSTLLHHGLSISHHQISFELTVRLK